MSDFFHEDPAEDVPLDAQIKCVEREIGLREGFYPRQVFAGKMSQRLADNELRGMKAVLKTLLALKRAA